MRVNYGAQRRLLSADNGGSFRNSFDVPSGDSINIEVYLQQTELDSVLTDEGIVSWGFDLSKSPSDLGTISNATANPSFDFENHEATTESGFEWEYAQSTGAGITGSEILLGSFQFETLSEGTTVFRIQDRIIGSGPGNASWFTPSFTELDEEVFGSGAANTFLFSVNATSAVPEPNSLALLSYAAVGFFLRRKRIACESF